MSDQPAPGYKQPEDSASDYNTTIFLCRRLIGLMNIATPVQVMAVTNNGGVSPVGQVDVMPLVSLVNSQGVASQHGTLHGIPYFRLQGGTNAVIIDPVVGDIGFCVFADRDISSVVKNKAAAAPGSARRNDFADGIYVGGILNGTPKQYIQFSDDGITLAVANGKKVSVIGDLTATGEIIAGFGGADQVGVQTHEHPTAATGAPSPPTPGT